jgi:hypothetical protein
MAIDFNGSNHNVSVTDANSLDLGDTFSLCTWMDLDVLNINFATILKKRFSNSAINYALTYHVDKLYFNFTSGGGIKQLTSNALGLSINTNYHVAITFSKPDVVFYLNAVPVGTGSLNFTPDVNNSSLLIGGSTVQFSNHFNGRLWDTMIYNRALSASEIKIIAESRGVDNITNGRVLFLRMNEKPTGSTASGAGSCIDLSGLGNHGTPVNNPTYQPKPIRSIK